MMMFFNRFGYRVIQFPWRPEIFRGASEEYLTYERKHVNVVRVL